ncbi:MAG: AAA family ATPase [Candidatus Aenigmatarchaeota archaeon]
MITDFNEKILRKVLELAINIADEKGNDVCYFDHIVLAIFKMMKKDNSYKEFIEKYEIDNFIKEIEKSLDNSNNRRKFLPPRFSKYSMDMIADKIENLKSEGRYFIDYYDILHLILREDKTNSSLSKYFLFTKFSEEEFFKDLLSLRNSDNNTNVLIKDIENIIEQHCINLNKLALENDNYNLIGREKEIFLVSKALCRKTKNNVILVGEPGVGKTSIVEGLAKKIVEKKIYKQLQSGVIYSTSVGDLLAGTKYRGDLEEKIKTIIDNLIKLSKIKNQLTILFIDEIHMIVGAGTSTDNRNVDIGNILKPILQSGNIRIIGATTHEEYNRFIEKDKALKRRFNKIVVEEPSEKEAIEILNGLKKYYENYHNVEYSNEAIESAVKLSKKFIYKSFLPDKAIDIIDNVASKLKLIRSVNEGEKIIITEEDIIEEISEEAKIPKEKILSVQSEKSDNLDLKYLSTNLKKKIFGQDSSIDEIVSTILVSRAGLRNSERPEAIFLINGPTGTGKTELCKQIAKHLNMNFARIDMSEFMEPHSVSKLIGAPPGYVGYEDNEGLLYNILERNPNSVLLFDEIEKANQQVINILLQIFDYGNLTTSKGKTIKFNNCIIFMTSNIGSHKNNGSIGFLTNKNENEEKDREERENQIKEINSYFSPEFRNRLDGIIIFNKLTKDVSLKIIDKFIDELREECLRDKNIELRVSEKVKEYLLRVGFDKKMGARPLSRIIDKKIKYKLAPEMLFGSLKNGGNVFLDLDEKEEIILNIDQLYDNRKEKEKSNEENRNEGEEFFNQEDNQINAMNDLSKHLLHLSN